MASDTDSDASETVLNRREDGNRLSCKSCSERKQTKMHNLLNNNSAAGKSLRGPHVPSNNSSTIRMNNVRSLDSNPEETFELTISLADKVRLNVGENGTVPASRHWPSKQKRFYQLLVHGIPPHNCHFPPMNNCRVTDSSQDMSNMSHRAHLNKNRAQSHKSTQQNHKISVSKDHTGHVIGR